MVTPNSTRDERQIAKFWAQVDQSGGEDSCWKWTRYCGNATNKGYGQYHFRDKKVYTHIFAYKLACGDVPQGLEVCHTCDNPSCCNPKHLFLASHQENMQDRSRKGRGGGARGRKPGLRKSYDDVPLREPNNKSGERNAKAKLTDDQVRRIRSRYAEGDISQRKLAAEYGVHASLIGFIVRRAAWQHVADEPKAAAIIQLPMFEDEAKKAA
jgi:hypothetical protein